MQLAAAYIPEDRRWHSSSTVYPDTAPQRVVGTVLFVDIAGFTPLTDAFVQRLGRRQGADAATKQLNTVYRALIAEIHHYGGTIIGFSGDGMLCWHDAGSTDPATAARAATAAAAGIQSAMADLSSVQIDAEKTVRLAVKTALASGTATRCLIGNPVIQVIDVLAGATVDRSAAAERLASQGETIADRATVDLLGAQGARRRDDDAEFALLPAEVLAAVVAGAPTAEVSPATMTEPTAVISPGEPLDKTRSETKVDAWVLPALRAELRNGASRALGELRPAVALFLRFGGLDFDAEEGAATRLDAYVRWAQSVLQRYEGALIQLTTGDKGSYLYAAFGAPIAHDDDLQRSAAAARTLAVPPASLPYRPHPQIGLVAGRMRVGAYGSETRCTYGVQGAAVNRAAQLMLKAAPDQILIDPGTAAQLRRSYILHDAGMVQIKGQTDPLPVFAVGAPIQDAPLTSSARFETPLRGRAALLAELMQIWTRVKERGRGTLVHIHGEAGIGKSHLLAGFVEQVKSADMAVVAVAACRSTEQHSAYFAARQIARWLLGLGPLHEAPAAEQIGHVTAYLGAIDLEWLPRLPLLADLLDLPIQDNDLTTGLTPRQRREALTDLAVEIVTASAQAAPMIFVIDDAQFMDEASRGLLQNLARTVEHSPLLIVVAQRPASEMPMSLQPAGQQVETQQLLTLDALKPKASREIVADRFDRPVSPLATALLCARAQGNPLMLEALIAALRENDQIVRSHDGVWNLAPAMLDQLRRVNALDESEETPQLLAVAAEMELGLPDSIHGIVLARLDQLPAPTRHLLRVASVLGPAFERSTLLAMQADEEALYRAVFDDIPLAAGDLLYAPPGQPTRIQFRHNVTQEVIYETLLDDQRRQLHMDAARALESTAPEAIEQLANHYVNSPLESRADRERCLHFLDLAGARAQKDYANETALHYVDLALGLESNWERLSRKIELLHLLGRREDEAEALAAFDATPGAPAFARAFAHGAYHEAVSSYDEAATSIEQALHHARAAGNPEQEARALARLGLIAWRQGDYPRATAVYQEALAILDADERFADEAADAHYGLGLVYRQIGRYEEAKARFEEALAIYRRIGHRPNEAKTLIAIGHVEHYRHRFDAALQSYRSALPIYRSAGDRAGIASSMLSIAQGLFITGAYTEAILNLEAVLELYRRLGDSWWESIGLNELGLNWMFVGEFQKAETYLHAGLALSEEIDDVIGIAYRCCNLGLLYRLMGQSSRARTQVQRAYTIAGELGDQSLIANCLQEMALIALDEHDYDASISRAYASIAIYEELGLSDQNISNFTALAYSHWRNGDLVQARENLSKARSLLGGDSENATTFPQREYLLVAEILASIGSPAEAQAAERRAYAIMQRRAASISDESMRHSFLTRHTFHQPLLDAFGSDVLPSSQIRQPNAE